MTAPVRNRAVTDVPPQYSGSASDWLAILGLSGAAIISALHEKSEAEKVAVIRNFSIWIKIVKTQLKQKLKHERVGHHIEVAIWKSALNSPSPVIR